MMRSTSESYPEIEVIADCLRSMYGSPGSPDFDTEGKAVWEALLDYWKNRAGGKVKTDEPMREAEHKPLLGGDFTEGICSVPFSEFPLPFMDGNQGIPGGRPIRFPLPPDFEEKVERADDIADHEDFVMSRLEAVREEIISLGFLPMFNDKDKSRLAKLDIGISKLISKYYDRQIRNGH